MVDHELLNQIDKLTLSPRANALRELFFATTPGVAAEHSVLGMQSWQETEGQPIDIRRARLFKKIAEGVPVPVFKGQKLVGSQTKYFRGAYPHPEYDGEYLLPLLKEEAGTMTLGGPVEKGVITPEDYAHLIEVVRFWRGKSPVERVHEVVGGAMGSWYDDLVDTGTPRYEAVTHGPNGLCWSGVIERGLRSCVTEAKERIRAWRAAHDDDVAKLHFWEASVIAGEAAITLAHRYAAEARALAAVEQDADWRKELERIAATCEWVPEHPARSFREGLQSLTLVHVALGLESPCIPPTSIGRLDKYLYPHFRRDLSEGRLTLAEAGDLMADLLQFCARQEWVMELSWRDYVQKGVVCNIGLAGTDGQGSDASNELSYLILHMMGLVRYAEPHIALGWHKNVADWLLRKALETNRKVGGGVPQFQNCDAFVDLMVRRGVGIENARNWVSHGCSQAEPDDQCTSMEPSYISIALAVDLTLHNGVASMTGARLGPETGDPRSFEDFGEFHEAFLAQVDHLIRKQLWHDNIVDSVRAEYCRHPLASALLPGCMEKGRDFTIGGLNHYRMNYKKDRGLVPAADSLVAIKKLVFDQRRLSMAELIDALDSDFAGARGAEIRQLCLGAPKYGNDIDEADFVLRDLGRFTAEVITSLKNVWGYNYALNRNGQSWHYMAGRRLGALPQGRKAGQPLADGSLSATQGMDRNGPTALLNSALKADFKEQSMAGILTVKFPAPVFETEELRDKVRALTEGFFANGGTYIQYNVLDASTLRAAKLNPEFYRDLVVRVGGYSAYFVNLSSDIQDEIIQRTEHSLVGV